MAKEKEKEKEKERELKLTPYFLKGMPSFLCFIVVLSLLTPKIKTKLSSFLRNRAPTQY
jgi:hypothetical protein